MTTLKTLATLATEEACDRYASYNGAYKWKEKAGSCIRVARDLVYNNKCPEDSAYIGALSAAAEAIALLSM